MRRDGKAPRPGLGSSGPDPRAAEKALRRQFFFGLAHDPLAFVRQAYRWDDDGRTRGGPRDWQAEVLGEIGAQLRDPTKGSNLPIRVAVASGHGVGKSALAAWLAHWGLATFAESRVLLTANTGQQLTTKTWPELVKWHHRLKCRHWFTLGAQSVRSVTPSARDTWRLDRVTWSEDNTEAFAGLHNLGKRIVVIYDEASTIADRVWEVTEGALTDAGTEIVWIAFGNPTRGTGRFRDCFGKHRALWTTRQIDSRRVDGANHALAGQWAETYGEDSDFVRVRVKGEFPRTGSLQFIGEELVEAAAQREAPQPYGAPVILGVDVARFGDDRTVIQPRRGLDACTLPARAFSGLDTMQVAAQVMDMAIAERAEAVFVDEGGIGAGVVDRLRQLRCPGLQGVNFGSRADGWSEALDGRGSKFANKRAEMWGRMKEWLRTGSIEGSRELAADLTGVEYGFNLRDEIQLESKDSLKARGLASPDHADALALTFAFPVGGVGRELSQALAPPVQPGGDGRVWWRARHEVEDYRPKAPNMLPDNWEPYQDED